MRTVLCVMMLLVATIGAAQTPGSSLTGNAERGKTLFMATYKCASCHGTTAESGSPRLVPMKRTQENFIAFVQKPTVAQMPAFGDQPAQSLADVYAYLKSIPGTTPPPVQNIPILNDVLKTIP